MTKNNESQVSYHLRKELQNKGKVKTKMKPEVLDYRRHQQAGTYADG